jgi:DNA-binding transcriptional LysR family regulator
VHLEDAIPEEQTIWALYPTKRQILPKVRIFVSEIRQALAEQG